MRTQPEAAQARRTRLGLRLPRIPCWILLALMWALSHLRQGHRLCVDLALLSTGHQSDSPTWFNTIRLQDHPQKDMSMPRLLDHRQDGTNMPRLRARHQDNTSMLHLQAPHQDNTRMNRLRARLRRITTGLLSQTPLYFHRLRALGMKPVLRIIPLSPMQTEHMSGVAGILLYGPINLPWSNMPA